MKKRILAFVLSVVLFATATPMSQVYAEEPDTSDERTTPTGTAVDADYSNAIDTEPTVTAETSTTSTRDSSRTDVDAVVTVSNTLTVADDSDPDAVFAAYLDEALYDGTVGGVSKYNVNLSGPELRFYRRWKNTIGSIASGENDNTSFKIYLRDYLTSLTYIASELGLSTIPSDNEQIAAALVGTAGISDAKISEMYQMLLLDCPFDLYWLDKTQATKTQISIPFSVTDDKVVIDADNAYISISMPVSADYRVGTYKTDVSKTSAAVKAANNAKAVVTEAAGLADADKLAYYRDWIIANASFNTAAYDVSNAYGDPWQLVYVFDGDPSTNVVCEGYAKAFKYLCDLSSFSSGIECYLVTGNIGDQGRSNTRHMWNVVHMSDGNNYIVDLTNYSPVYPNDLFLSGYYKSVLYGYVCKAGTDFISYTYDSRTRYYYGGVKRSLSASNFGVEETVKKQVDNGADDGFDESVVDNVEDPENDRYFGDDSEVETFTESDLSGDAAFATYTGIDGGVYAYPAAVDGQPVATGVDVSHYQGGINWGGLKARGVNFAIIRAGYRSVLSGSLAEDSTFRSNIQGAYAAGIPVGIYFFSQATNPAEAAEEANYCASLIAPYRGMISLPVFIDYEYADSNGQPGRLRVAHSSDGNNRGVHTDTINTFCGTMNANGYNSGVYSNMNMFNNHLNMSALGGNYYVWLANYTNATAYGGRVNAWQYTSSYTGFAGLIGSARIDMDFWFGGGVPGSTVGGAASGAVNDYVSRLYRVVLQREPDAGGLQGWASAIQSGGLSAADAAFSFYLSQEMLNRNLDNAAYVERLYEGILGRPSDAGNAGWISMLNSGSSYESVISGFLGSPEFANICATYGLPVGRISIGSATYPRAGANSAVAGGTNGAVAASGGVSDFVSRLYTQALGRQAEPDGLNGWSAAIVAQPERSNLYNIALNGFLHSPEFTNKNLDNAEYVKVLYRTFLGREPEPEGLAGWTNALNSGQSRDEVASGFAYSPEFSNIMSSYGL